MGIQIWMSWTIVIYNFLLNVWVACLDKKKPFFWGEKNVFLDEIFLFFKKNSENLPNFQCQQNMEKETMILMLNVSHKGVFLQFWIFTFLSFQ
jgi:hypothetical protein